MSANIKCLCLTVWGTFFACVYILSPFLLGQLPGFWGPLALLVFIVSMPFAIGLLGRLDLAIVQLALQAEVEEARTE